MKLPTYYKTYILGTHCMRVSAMADTVSLQQNIYIYQFTSCERDDIASSAFTHMTAVNLSAMNQEIDSKSAQIYKFTKKLTQYYQVSTNKIKK